MANLEICRICLRTDLKTYRLDQYQLLAYYEEVMAQKTCAAGDALPRRVCCECAARLRHAHRFKELCYAGQYALRDLLRRGTLTNEALNKLDRNESNLLIPLSTMIISERVKCYCTRYTESDDEETPTNKSDKTDSKQINLGYVAKDMFDTDLAPNGTNNVLENSEECMVAENTDMESKSVLIVDIKDESTVDNMAECDPVAMETSDTEIVPVIEFIDIKREGVKVEELVQKQKRQKKAPQRCKRVQSKDEDSNKTSGKRKKAKVSKEWSRKNRKPDDSPAFITNQSSEPKRRKKLKKLKRKPTTCYQCGATFSTQLQCMRHHVTAHPRTSFYSPADRHICEICGASLAPSSVSAHQNMHSREKLHACDTCGRAFHAAVGLRRHLVTHTGERRYACSLCDKRFTQSNSCKLHHRTVHLKQPYPKRNRRRAPAATERDSNTSDSGALERDGPSAADALERDKLLTSDALERDGMPAAASPHYLTLP